MQARYLQVGAVLLFTLPTFVFLTCSIYLQLSSGISVSLQHVLQRCPQRCPTVESHHERSVALKVHARCRMAATQATACLCGWPGPPALPTGAAWSCPASPRRSPHLCPRRTLRPRMWSLQTPPQSTPPESLRPQACSSPAPVRGGEALAAPLQIRHRQRSLPSRRRQTSQPQARRPQTPQQRKGRAWRSAVPQASCPQTSLTSKLPLSWPHQTRCAPRLPCSAHKPPV